MPLCVGSPPLLPMCPQSPDTGVSTVGCWEHAWTAVSLNTRAQLVHLSEVPPSESRALCPLAVLLSVPSPAPLFLSCLSWPSAAQGPPAPMSVVRRQRQEALSVRAVSIAMNSRRHTGCAQHRLCVAGRRGG